MRTSRKYILLAAIVVLTCLAIFKLCENATDTKKFEQSNAQAVEQVDFMEAPAEPEPAPESPPEQPAEERKEGIEARTEVMAD